MFVHRPILMSDAGIVVSGHHKASEAGAAVLRAGGNAMDAAIAASATLCVAIPHMNGLAGDAIALYHDAATRRVTAINGSGRAPAAATPDAIRGAGHAVMPKRGPLTISVFGLVDAWERSLARFGTRSLPSLLEPAAALAASGVPVDLTFQTFLAGPVYAALAAEFPALAALYGAPGQRPLGERVPNPALARTLRAVMEGGAETFYRGAIARALLADLSAAGALMTAEDLAAHETLFDQPLRVDFAGRRLNAAPPNSQGLALALLAGQYDRQRAASGHLSPVDPAEYLPIKETAFVHRARHTHDPDGPRPDRLLEAEALDGIIAERRMAPAPHRPAGDTSTLVVIDRWGNAVSWVQSLFEEFGSAVVSPETGLVAHNRLALQGIEPDAPWPLRPGKRPFHTLCPALVENEDGCEIAIATPGDHGQPQSIFQVLLRMFAEGHHIQAAIEAPRLRHDGGSTVMLEDRAPAAWAEAIRTAGYDVSDVGPWSRLMGGVNAIQRRADGLLMAGADPRRASYAVTAD
jgi:gamma-glutamyltranspeptidase/glutathione hydrolase